MLPLSGDVGKITRRAEEFRDLHESLQKNLQTYLSLTMDALDGVHKRVKASMVADATRQMVRRSLLNRMALELTTIDLDQPPQKVSFVDGVCGYSQISHVPRRIFVFGETGCGDFAVKSRPCLCITDHHEFLFCCYPFLAFLTNRCRHICPRLQVLWLSIKRVATFRTMPDS